MGVLMKKFLPSILFQAIFFTTLISNPYPADISFCIADLKYDGKNIKICELGDGVLSMFQGYDSLYKPGDIWVSFWDFLNQFDIPCWFVGIKPTRTRHQEMSLGYFTKLGGRCIDRITKLEELELFKKIVKKKKVNLQSIRESMGCVILRNSFSPTYLVTRSTEKHPSLIFLDRSTKEFISSKYLTNKLFHEAGLEFFRPICKSYPKVYTENLAREIIQDIPGKIYVIKPINASLGNGVIIIEQHNLDQTLRLILQDNNQELPAHLEHDISYSHWKKDTNNIFLVEEFVVSKPITVEKQIYDPTMRVIFVVYNDLGIVNIKFLGAYWKLPAKSLQEQATLTECHKSKIARGRTSSTRVDIQDLQNVQAILEPVLYTAYLKMLEATYKKKN